MSYATTELDSTFCAWCEHNIGAHNSLLRCCVRDCDCKHMQTLDDLEDQTTMDPCVEWATEEEFREMNMMPSERIKKLREELWP